MARVRIASSGWDFDLEVLGSVFIKGSKPSEIVPEIVQTLEDANNRVREETASNKFTDVSWNICFVLEVFEERYPIEGEDDEDWVYLVVIDDRMPKRDTFTKKIQYAELVVSYKPASGDIEIGHEPDLGVYTEWYYGEEDVPNMWEWIEAIEGNVAVFEQKQDSGDTYDDWDKRCEEWKNRG